MFELNDRVVTFRGDVGVIEEIADDGLYKVRCYTPDNKPSCLSTWIDPKDLKDGTNVLPTPRSKKWKAEARSFQLHVEDALREII